MSSLLSHLDLFPPYLIRLTARRGRRAMTDREISAESGLSTNTVCRISHCQSWSHISVGVASKFIEACGVDVMRPRRLKEYVKTSKFAHLKRGALERYTPNGTPD